MLGNMCIRDIKLLNDFHYFKQTCLNIPERKLQEGLIHEFLITPLTKDKEIQASMIQL